MKALNIMEATVYTSPNPLTLICSQNEDGTTNLAPICFVSYLSFNPPMVGFATGKQSHTGKRVRETSKVIVTVPGENLAGVVMACGSSTGAKVNKVAENNIEMKSVEDSDIQIPADTKLAMVATLQEAVDVERLWKSCTRGRRLNLRTLGGVSGGCPHQGLYPEHESGDRLHHRLQLLLRQK